MSSTRSASADHLYNKTGGHTHYVYDKLGRPTYEYVWGKAYRPDGSVEQDGYYKTQLTYDFRGNSCASSRPICSASSARPIMATTRLTA